jgi:hypothetical protein
MSSAFVDPEPIIISDDEDDVKGPRQTFPVNISSFINVAWHGKNARSIGFVWEDDGLGIIWPFVAKEISHIDIDSNGHITFIVEACGYKGTLQEYPAFHVSINLIEKYIRDTVITPRENRILTQHIEACRSHWHLTFSASNRREVYLLFKNWDTQVRLMANSVGLTFEEFIDRYVDI